MTRKQISKSLRFDVLNRDRFKCRYCGVEALYAELHIDHVTPVALGGTNDIDNLVAACIPCNLGKRAKLPNLDDEPTYDWLDCPFADGWPNDIEEPVYWYNDTWAVTDFGMERLGGFYAIEGDDLPLASITPGHENISMWLEHLSNKVWAAKDIETTITALAAALRNFEQTPRFDWARSVELARANARRVALLRHPLTRPFGSIFSDEDDEA